MLAFILLALLSFEDKIQSTAVHLISESTECSGTIIDATHILTARHCIGEDPFLRAEVGGPTVVCHGLEATRVSKTQDLALIEIKDCGALVVATLADSPMARGDSFTIIGLSYDVPWALARGFVMSPGLVRIECEKHKFQDVALFCQGCDEGDSGSGVFNNKGELAGVFVAASQNNVRAYMVPLKDVKAFLHGN